MRRILSCMAFAILALALRPVWADEAPQPEVAQTTARAYVGIFVAPLHPAQAARLPELNHDQGLMVEDVASDSPAQKAGIQPHDILTTYDDQKLFSPDQFAKLVRSDKVGREVTVQFLRDGKAAKALLVLGKQEVPSFRPWQSGPDSPPLRPRRMWRRFEDQPVPGTDWANFDSLTLKKLENNKFRAEIQYLDKDQKLQKHAFEGTRDEIYKSVVREKDLKPNEREHLLRSMNMGSDFPFGNPWFEPGIGWRLEPPVR